jgi:hypothetical protein
VEKDRSIITNLRLQHEIDVDSKLQHRSLVCLNPT